MKNIEIWKSTPPIEEYYEVSNLGNVRNVLTKRLIRPNKNAKGYYSIRICNQKLCKTFKVHRLVMMAFSPVDNYEDLYVNHKDFNPSNNELDNLEWVSPQENSLYSQKKGRYKNAYRVHSERMKQKTRDGSNYLIEFNKTRCGERSTFAKLTESDVQSIRIKRSQGETCTSLGIQYGVSHRTISQICLNKSWKHIK